MIKACPLHAGFLGITMSDITEVRLTDIGDFNNVDVRNVLVAAGDLRCSGKSRLSRSVSIAHHGAFAPRDTEISCAAAAIATRAAARVTLTSRCLR